MTKTGLFLTSFVAAVPGGILAYQMVMAFLNYSGGPTTITKALAGMLLCIGGLLAVMPFGILVFAGPKAEKPPKKAKEAAAGKSAVKKQAESGEVEAEVEADEDEESVAVTDQNLEVVEGEEEEFAQTLDDEEAAADDFETGDASEDEAVVVDSDDFVEEVEEVDAPKKGKKK